MIVHAERQPEEGDVEVSINKTRITPKAVVARLAGGVGLGLALAIVWAGVASALSNGQPCPPYWSEATPPAARLAVSPAHGRPIVPLQFDAGASISGTAFESRYNGADAACEESAAASADPISSYRWNWGDGKTETDASPLAGHTYAAPGTYTVTLTVQEKNGHTVGATTTYFTSTTSKQVTIFNPPSESSFTASMHTGQVVVVDAPFHQDGIIITDYYWDWGDGTATDTLSSPTSSHSYATGGMKTISLTVTDNFGDSGSAAETIHVPGPPVASFTAPATVTAGRPAKLEASGSSAPVGDIVGYEWEFGDGHTQTTGTPTIDHTYAAAGEHVVTLTVKDSSGDSAQVQRTINVEPSSSANGSPHGGTTATTGGHTRNPKCVAPKLHGDKLAQARRALAAHHCKLGTVKRRPAPKREKNRVIAQSVKPGKTLSEGSVIGVTVGRKKTA